MSSDHRLRSAIATGLSALCRRWARSCASVVLATVMSAFASFARFSSAYQAS